MPLIAKGIVLVEDDHTDIQVVARAIEKSGLMIVLDVQHPADLAYERLMASPRSGDLSHTIITDINLPSVNDASSCQTCATTSRILSCS